MATITFNGENFEVDHAVKGGDFVHGYDADGNCIIAIDGVSDFSDITYDGVYMDPRDCLAEPCNSVKYCGGSLKTADGEVINKLDVLWENASPTSSFAEQTLTIDGLGEYDVFMVTLLRNNESTNRSTTVCDTNGRTEEVSFNCTDSAVTDSYNITLRQRVARINRGSNTVKFSNGWCGGATTGNSSASMIPLYIRGQKEG